MRPDCGLWGSGMKGWVWGLGSRVPRGRGLGFRVQDLRFRVPVV